MRGARANDLNPGTIRIMGAAYACPDRSNRRSEPVFRRDPAASHYPDAPAEGRISWNYDRVEIFADGIVHAAGIILALAGTVVLLIAAAKLKPVELAPTAIYAVGLLVMLVISAAYNMWPVSPTKWLLRRFDHSAIYLLIAGTYTPFLALLKSGAAFAVLALCMWSSAFAGMFLKIALPGRFDRISIALYLLLGWSGVMAYDYFAPVLPVATIWLLVLGGIFYSLGTIFHLWENLRFQNVIWHVFVLIAAACHYWAVLTCLAV
jgi:hemolysin III